jgi:hypothetical protein
MSSRFAFAAGVLLASLAALPLSAQQSSSKPRDTSAAKPSISGATGTDSAIVDLGRAITALAMSVQSIVDEAKRNPEVRRAALQTASLAVSVAQKALEENRGEIEKLLDEASRKISTIDAEQKAKQVAPRKSEPTTH